MGPQGAHGGPPEGARRRADVGALDTTLSGDALTDATVEMTRHLGSTEPAERTEAVTALVDWIARGAHDDLLSALGHGMTAGLASELGTGQGPSVLRRAGSAQVLAAVIERGTEQKCLSSEDVTTWCDQVFAWLVRERDAHSPLLRPGPGAVGHGGAVLVALARSEHLDVPALTVMLDVVADRVLLPVPRLAGVDVDLLARAVVGVVTRDCVPLTVLEPWVRRIVAEALPTRASRAPVTPGPAQSARDLLRAVHLRLVLGAERPEHRVDLLLALSEAIRDTSPDLFDA